MYISIKKAAAKWNISEAWVKKLCIQGRVNGAIVDVNGWIIPIDAEKPRDLRTITKKNYIKKLSKKLSKLLLLEPFDQTILKAIQDEFLAEFCYNSNAIEGTYLRDIDVKHIILKNASGGHWSIKNIVDVIGFKQAFEYVTELVKKDIDLNEEVIKKVHDLVLANDWRHKGKYRNVDVRISNSNVKLCEPKLIRQKIVELINTYKQSEKDLVTKIARFHLEYEQIHPFIDGNGRSGRILVNFLLMQNSYPPIDIRFKDQFAYYKAFELYYANNDIDPMCKMIAMYMNDSLDIYLNAFSKKNTLAIKNE